MVTEKLVISTKTAVGMLHEVLGERVGENWGHSSTNKNLECISSKVP